MSRSLPPRLQKLLRWFTWRRCLILLASLLALVIAFYEVERWRGKRAMDAQLARYAAEGISLNPHDYLPPRVAPEDNFCATPLLDGIALSNADDTITGWKEAQAKRERLNFQIRYPYEDEDFMAAKKLVPWSKLLDGLAAQSVANGTPRTRPKGAPAYLPRWKVTKNAPATAESVYIALDAEKEVFDELIAASRRSKAVFTPQPCDYFPFWEDREIYYGEKKLKSLIRLRLAAAAETARFAEAADLIRVLWRFREALVAEPAGSAYDCAVEDLKVWTGAVLDVLACRPPAEIIRSLMAQPLSWDAEQEYKYCMEGGAASCAFVWQTVSEDARWTFRGRLHDMFRPHGFYKIDETKTMLRRPSGWLMQNGASRLRSKMDFRLEPFSRGGFAALPKAEVTLTRETEEAALLDRLIVRYQLYPGQSEFVCRYTQQARLTILALAMELHRSTKGRYPDTLAALVPEFLPSIPEDLDGASMRAVVAPDGQQAVIYSVGWNQQDDWHGIPPENPGSAREATEWFLKLPIVRSEPAPETKTAPLRSRR